MVTDTVIQFPTPRGKPTEADVKADIRAHCAAVVAMMQQPAGKQDLLGAMHLLDAAWAKVLGLMVSRGEMP